jgi:tape measure domain-containing protein
MSQTIDQRIVDMRFNNKQFAQGVKSSLKDLKNLKQGLDLKNAGRGLSALQNAGNKFNMSGMANAVSNIASKFSAMGVVGFTVMQNLTNKVIDLGRTMGNKFMKPMNEGFSEYELKMNSIQTIMTNVRDKGTSLAEVNDVLDDLNTYADKTIYNFAQMTDNLGKFTTAGIGAKEAATTLKGIGNVAAGFGVDAQRMAGATYQISQALQSATFRLEDWNSISAAGMGGTMLQDALKDTAKDMGVFVDESIPFRLSLEQGWLSAEVFTATMAKMAEDKDLLAAAQNVTTFTKLLGVMAEVRASGWASTWEAIVGNKDQSTRLWTGIANAFGDVVGAVDAARTAMFKFWNEKGGRRDFLIGIANILFILADIVEPIEEAFSDIFEAMSGKKLVAMSKSFRELTENFKISDEVADLLKRTFTGLFSVISIGKKIALGLVKSVFVIIKAFTSLSSGNNGLLKMTANIGDFLSYLDKTVFSADNISSALSALGVIMAPVAKTIKNSFMLIGGGIAYLSKSVYEGSIGEYFASLKTKLLPTIASIKNNMKWLADNINIDAIFDKIGSSVSSAFNKIKELFGSIGDGSETTVSIFSKIGSVISKVFGAISGFFKGVANAIKGVGGSLSSGAGGLGEMLSNIWGSLDFEKLESLLKGSLLASIVLILRKFLNGIANISEGLGDFMGEIVETLEAVKETLETYQKSIKATILIKIAAAIAILALSLIALSMIDGDKLKVGLTAMGVLIAEVFGAMYLFNKNMDLENTIDFAKMAAGLMGLAVAILVLSAAMFIIGKLNIEDAGQGLLGIAGLVGILIGVSKTMNTGTVGLAKLSLQFIILAAALTAMVIPLVLMGMLPWETLKKGLIGMGNTLVGLVGFLKLMENIKKSESSAKALLTISAALVLIAGALYIIGSMSWEQIGKGLSAIGASLLILAGAMKIIKPTDVASAQALMIIVASMLLMSVVLRTLGIMEWETVAKGLMFMIASLGILAGAMKIIKPTDVASAVALTIIAGSLLIMGTVLRDLGSMDWEVMGKGLAAMAGSLLILVVATNAMSGAAVGAGAIVAISIALMLLVPSIMALSTLPIKGVGIALLALAGIFTVLGLAAYVIGPMAPVVIMLAGSVALLGAGVLLTGIGVGILAAGLVALAGAVYANGAAFVILIKDIAPLIPMFMKNLGRGIIEFIKQFNKAIPELGKTVIAIFKAIVDVIETSGIIVIDAILKFILEVFEKIDEYLPKFIEVGTSILINLLTGISDSIGKITEVVSDIITQFINALTKKQDAMLEAGAKFIITFINNLADTIRENKILFKEAIINLVSSVLGITKEDVKSAIDSFKKMGGWLIEGLKEGIIGRKPLVVKGIGLVAKSIIGKVTEIFEINSPSKIFRAIGQNIMDSLTSAIDDNSPKPILAAKKMTTGVVKESEKVAKGSTKVLKSAFDRSVAWIEERKYFNELSLQEELEFWQDIQSIYAKGTEERTKADREEYRIKNAIRKAGYDNSVKWIEKEKYYNRLSLKDELSAWERVQARYAEGSEEQIQSAREVYRVRKELSEKLEADTEKLEEDSEETIKATYEHSVKWIEKERKYKRLTLKEELAAWKRVKVTHKDNIEERTNAEQEMARVTAEINQSTLDFYDEVVKVNEDANDQRAKLDKEYYDKEKALNVKRLSDIKNVNDAYENAVNSRSSSLYGTFGLFEEADIVDPDRLKRQRDELKKEISTVSLLQKKYEEGSDERKAADDRAVKAKESLVKVEEELITGDELLSNLTSQVHAFELWQKDIKNLSKKGIDDGLIKELEAMGPKSTKQIKALLMLSEKELEKYVFLWQVKHKTAKDQAVDELEYLKTETITKISEINSESAIELNKYKVMWADKLKTLASETDVALVDLKSKWKARLGEVREDSENEIIELVSNVKKELTKPKWSEIGAGMLKEILVGIQNGTAALADGAKAAATTVLATMRSVLSPNPKTELAGIAGFMTNALTGEPLRYAPVIKPVFDLSNIRSGQSEMDRIFDSNRTLNTTPNNFGFSENPTPSGTINNSVINVAQLVVREEADVPKISRELENMRTTRSR